MQSGKSPHCLQMAIKILVADDNSFIREGMKIILSTYEDFEIAGYCK